MGQLRTRDTELQQAIKRIAELEQVILGPAKRKWMSVERNSVKVSNVRAEENVDGADVKDYLVDILSQPTESNGKCAQVKNLAGTNGNTSPSNGQLRPSNGQLSPSNGQLSPSNGQTKNCRLVCTSLSQPANVAQSQRVTERSQNANVQSQLENVQSQTANSPNESLTNITVNARTASVVPEINHNCARTGPNDSEDTSLSDVFSDRDEIDLSEALFAMMSMGDSQSLSDVSNSNSESNASSDVDSDVMDL